MPKRKAETSLAGGGAEASSTPKKSKKEARAEASARAKAWHEARSAGGGAAAKSTPSSSRATATSAPATAPVFSTGKATPPSKTSSSSKRRMTPSTTTSATTLTPPRNPTSGIGATSGRSRSSSTRSTSSPSISDREGSTAQAKKTRRSVGTNASKFEFAPPSPAETSSIHSSPHTNTKQSASEIRKKRKDGLEAIQKLRMERHSKGLQTMHPLEQHNATKTTTAMKTTSVASAVDPPPSAAMSASAASGVRSTTTATASAKSPSPAQRTKIPASVASLFSKQSPLLSPSSQKSPSDPPYEQFDPSQPFPTSGYKLRTAAYCGCGPTPNSNNIISVRGSTAAAAAASSSSCQTMTRAVPFTTPRVQYGVGSEATREGGNDEEDDRKMPYQRPSPPGQYGSGGAQQPQRLHQAEPLLDAGVLANAISRARGILSSVAVGSQRHREVMGIRGLSNENDVDGRPNHLPGDAHSGGNDVGFPQRGALLPMSKEQPKVVAANASLDGNGDKLERPQVNPPKIHSSSSIPFASKLLNFRNGTGGASHPPERSSVGTGQPSSIAAPTSVADETNTTLAKTSIKTKSSTTTNLASSSLSVPPTSFWMATCRFIVKLLLVVQVGMGILYLVANSLSTRHFLKSDSIPRIDAKIDHVSCFINHPHTMNDLHSDSDQTFHQCEGTGTPCPQWGRCKEGMLLDCNEGGGTFEGWHRFVPSAKGDHCVPSPEANKSIRLVQDVLLRMTSNLVCQLGWEDDDETFPLFSIESVADKVREMSKDEQPTAAISSDLLEWLSPVFDANLVRFGALSRGNGSEYVDAIGLGQDVRPNSLPLPMRCRLSLMLWELLGYLFQSSWGLAWFLVKSLFRFTTSYPIYSIGALSFGKLVQYFKRRRKHRAKVRELHGIVLEAVYDRLSECEDHEGYAALILRDDVGHDMYPTNISQRLFINDYVWPRVSLEIRADNRVRKFRKLANGKELEHWDFAFQSKRGRRLRKSLGTPVESGSSKIAGSGSEDLLPKRDP